MLVKAIEVGYLQTNCYVVADETTLFARAAVSSGVRVAPICASAVDMPVKMLPMSAIVPDEVFPVNGMRMP